MLKKDKKAWKNRRSIWLTRLAFLLLSIFLWTLLKLSSSDLHAVVEVPVKLVDQPLNVMLVDPPTSMKVRYSGFGLSGLMERWKDQQEIELPFESFASAGDGRYFLSTDRFQNSVANRAPEGIAWNGLVDTLWIATGSLERVKLPVVSRLHLQFEAPYYKLGQPVISPDSIYIFGPKGILDTMQFYLLPVHSASNVNHQVNVEFPVELSQPLHSSTEQVRVIQEVAPTTEKWVEVELQNETFTNKWKAFPSVVRVRCRVAVEDYSRLHGALFKATYKRLIEGDAEVPVKWDHVPEFVEVLDWTPKYVELIEQ